MLSLKEKILAAPNKPLTPVVVPEWDCTVYVKAMSAATREKMEAAYTETGWRERMLVATLCDESGKPIFTFSDVVALSEKDAAPIIRLQQIATATNAMGTDARDDEKKD